MNRLARNAPLALVLIVVAFAFAAALAPDPPVEPTLSSAAFVVAPVVTEVTVPQLMPAASETHPAIGASPVASVARPHQGDAMRIGTLALLAVAVLAVTAGVARLGLTRNERLT